MRMTPFLYPHLYQPNKSVGNENKVKYDGFVVPLKKHFFFQ